MGVLCEKMFDLTNQQTTKFDHVEQFFDRVHFILSISSEFVRFFVSFSSSSRFYWGGYY